MRRRTKGFTLLEMLVTMGVGLAIVAAAYAIYTFQSKSYLVIEEEVQSLQNARMALEQMSRELRMASFGVVGQESIVDAKVSDITFLGDIDSDITGVLAQDADTGDTVVSIDLNDEQDTVENGEYVFLHHQDKSAMVPVADSGDLYDLSGEPDTINLDSALTEDFPATTTIVKTVESITYSFDYGQGVLNKNGSPFATGIANIEFHYFDKQNNEIVPQALASLNQTERAAVRRVEILVETSNPLKPGETRSYQTGVDLRNMGNPGFAMDQCEPNPPTSPSITDDGTCGHFTVAWTAPTQNACDGTPLTDLGGYKINFGESSGVYYAPAYNVSQETLTEFEVADLRLEDGNTYYVQLLAYDNSFNESAPTSEISFTLDDDTRPVPPTNLDATAGVGSVTLTWTASEDVDVKGYRVYRGTSQGFTPGPGNMIVDESAVEADDTQFTDTTVSACETYVYKVAAVDCVDAGEASDEAYGDGAGGGDDAPVSGQTNTTSTEDPASAPNPPSPFGATGGNQNVHLSWTSPSAPDFEKLVIRYATTTYPGSIVAGSLAGEVECAPGATFSFDHTGLTNGITYYYSAFACDRCGNCSAAAQSSAMPNLAGPVVQIITPGAGQVINDGELVYQARAYDPDQADLSATPNVDTDNGKGIAAITFHVTPEPTDSGWPRAEYAKEYCGFGGDMNPCAEGDVSTWCAGTYDLYVVAQDDEGQTTQSPYTQIVVQSGGIDDDQTYTKTISGTNNQILTFQVINSSDASVKLLGLQAEWDRANARLGGVAVPAGTVIWTDADLGHQAASGEEFTFDTGSQPTIGAGDSATIQLVFEHFATTLAGVAGPGSTSISVSSSAGFSAGDTVYIDSGAGQEAVQVASVSTGVLNLTGAVSGTHIYGARVSLTANDNEMNMAGALVNVSLNYEKSSGGLVCESDDIAVVVAAGPVIGTPYQDEPSANTSMSQTVGLVHVQNYRPVPVHVTVTDYSGTGLSSVRAYYKVDSGMATTPPSTGYAYVDMAYDSGDARWEGTIPFATNARVWVYFLATDNQSATDRKPPSGAYTYDLDADTTPPSCPLGLVATAVGGDDIDLDWQKNSEEDVIGYNVYRRKDCGNWAKVYTQVTDQETGSPDVVDYTDNAPQLNPGNFCYGYYLRAVDSSGNQSESCESYTADAGDCPCP